MQKLSRWNEEYLNPILQRDPSTTPDARKLKFYNCYFTVAYINASLIIFIGVNYFLSVY